MNWIKKYSFGIIIFILAFLAYANTLSHYYAWDDTIVILENERVQQGLNNVSSFFQNIKSEEVQHRYGYRPITLLSFAAEYEFFGFNPKVGHFINVLLFSLLCCLLFYVLKRLFPQKNNWFPFLITLLFLAHPIHTEVVANIKSRDELLTAFFGLLAILNFLNFSERERKKGLSIFLTLFFLVLSFLSRENGVVFIGILALIAYYKNTKKINSYALYGSVAFGFLMLLAIRLFSNSELVLQDNNLELLSKSLYHEDGFLGNPLVSASGILEILANSFYILWEYIELLIFPYPLLHDYGYGQSYLLGWDRFWVWISVVFHICLLYFVIKKIKKKSILIFGILFYFITISIYLHIFRVGPDYMAERYLFIPSIGFCIVVLCLLERVFEHSFSKEINSQTVPKKKLIIGCIILITGLYIFRTIDRNNAWKNNHTLFATDIVNLSECARANYNYASLLHKDYYENPSQELQEKILKHYQKSVSVTDRSIIAILNLGNAYMEFGYPNEAKKIFEKGVNMYPNVATPYMQLGKYYFSQNEYDKASELYIKAIEHGVKNAEIYYMYSASLLKLKQPENAFNELKKGLKYNPEEYVYFELLSDLALYFGEKEKAISYLQKAIDLAPGNKTLKDKLQKLQN